VPSPTKGLRDSAYFQDRSLLPSLRPGVTDRLDAGDGWQELGQPAGLRTPLGRVTRAAQPCGDDLMLPVGVTTDRGLGTPRHAWHRRTPGEGLGSTDCTLFHLCVLFFRVSQQAVKRFLKQECKCHGVSGSCTLRTCWLAMADFRRTGDYLWKKYNGAIQVVMNQDGTGFTVANKRFKKPTKNDLVYFESSPDYCIRDRDVGKPPSLHVNGFISDTCNWKVKNYHYY